MEIGLFTSGYQRNPLDNIFEDAANFGYNFIELWGGRPHAYAPDILNGDAKRIRDLSRKYRMPITVYTPEMNAYPFNIMAGSESMRIDSVNYVKRAIKAAKEIGSEYTLISAGHGGYMENTVTLRTRLLKCLLEISDFAASEHHKVLLEPLTIYESNICTTANELKNLLDEVNSEYLLGMCDVVVPFVQHECILTYLNKLGSKLHHIHVVDSDGKYEKHIMPGDGVLPLDELLPALKQAGYDKTLTIELVTGYMNEPRLFANRAIKRIRSYLA